MLDLILSLPHSPSLSFCLSVCVDLFRFETHGTICCCFGFCYDLSKERETSVCMCVCVCLAEIHIQTKHRDTFMHLYLQIIQFCIFWVVSGAWAAWLAYAPALCISFQTSARAPFRWYNTPCHWLIYMAAYRTVCRVIRVYPFFYTLIS